jgi:hypothetical protein
MQPSLRLIRRAKQLARISTGRGIQSDRGRQSACRPLGRESTVPRTQSGSGPRRRSSTPIRTQRRTSASKSRSAPTGAAGGHMLTPCARTVDTSTCNTGRRRRFRTVEPRENTNRQRSVVVPAPSSSRNRRVGANEAGRSREAPVPLSNDFWHGSADDDARAYPNGVSDHRSAITRATLSMAFSDQPSQSVVRR